MAPDGTTEEAFRLARAMTLRMPRAACRTVAAKSVISVNPKIPLRDKDGLIRPFAKALADLTDYIEIG